MGERTVFEGQHLDAGEHRSCLSRNATGALPPERKWEGGKGDRKTMCMQYGREDKQFKK